MEGHLGDAAGPAGAGLLGIAEGEGFYYTHEAALGALSVAQNTLEDPMAGQACKKPTYWVASPSPGPPLGRQMVMGVGLLDRGEKRARSVPEKGVSGKAYRSDPSVAL